MDVLSAAAQVTRLQSVTVSPPQRDDGKGLDARVVEGEQQRSALKLKLTTADGDEVKLRFVDQRAERTELRVADDAANVRHTERASQRYSIRIEGDLDAGEREALGQVVDAALQLAEDFFAGAEVDVSAFLTAAGSNGDEIASASLKLSQRSQSVARYALEGDGGDGSPLRSLIEASNDLARRVSRLGEGLRALVDARGDGLASPAAQLARATVAAGIDVRGDEIATASPATGGSVDAAAADPSAPSVAPSAAPAGAEAKADEDSVADADDAEPSADDRSATVPATPGAADDTSSDALKSLREQLLAALDAASAGRPIEFEVRHSARDATRLRISVFA